MEVYIIPQVEDYFTKGRSASIRCPYCHRDIYVESLYVDGIDITADIFEEKIKEIHYIWKNKEFDVWWMTICPNCSNPMLILNKGKKVLPSPCPEQIADPSVEEQVRNAYNEASLCFSVGAYHASTIMCRRALERLCIDKGATGRNLKEKIESLSNMGYFTKEIKEWAHANREIANDGAHDEEHKVDEKDANDILLITEKLIEIIYIIPNVAKTQLDKRKTGITNRN